MVSIVVVIGGIVLVATQLGGDDGDDDEDATNTTEATTGADDTVADDTGDVDDTDVGDTADTDVDDTEDVDEDVQEYADALAPLLAEFSTVDDDAAECVGVGFVDRIGLDRLESSGVTPDDFATGNPLDGQFLTVPDGEHFVSSLKDCGVSPREYFLEGFVQGAERTACIDEALSDADIETTLAHAIPNQEPSSDIMDVLTSQCPPGS